MKKQNLRVLAGIDLGWWTHVVCALDSKGNFLKEASFSHDAASLTEIANWLLKLAKGDPNRIAVATEKPHGAVVDSLLTRNIPVYAINPKQVDRFRDRHSVAGAKDDRRDAFVLADALRTDGHRFNASSCPPRNSSPCASSSAWTRTSAKRKSLWPTGFATTSSASSLTC